MSDNNKYKDEEINLTETLEITEQSVTFEPAS